MQNSIFTAKVSFLPRKNCKDADIKTIHLADALLGESWRSQVEAVRNEQNENEQTTLKNQLPCFTPSGTFSHVAATGLIEHSGFISIDIDCKPQENPGLESTDLKAIIKRVPHVAYCGKSCRGKGYVLIIPIANPTKHREYFEALAYHFERAGLKIDKNCKDVSRKRFVSWDGNPYINTAAEVWDITLPESKSSKTAAAARALPDNESSGSKEGTRAKVEDIISRCEAEGIDIADDYHDWINILRSLATEFGFDGEDYAHRISAIDSRYTYDETHHKYNELLASNRGGLTIGTFFHIAREKMGTHDFNEIQD